MYFTVVFFAATLFTAANGQCKTPYHDCGSTDMKISSLTIPNCCSAPCILKRGTNVSVTIEFTTDKTYTQMTQVLCGELENSCIRLGSLPPDFCKYTTCPIEAGKVHSAKVELPVLKTYPPITVVGNWTFYGTDTNSTVGCVEIPLKLQ